MLEEVGDFLVILLGSWREENSEGENNEQSKSHAILFLSVRITNNNLSKKKINYILNTL